MREIIPNSSLNTEKIIRICSEYNNPKIFINNLKTIIYPSADSPEYLDFIKLILEQFFKFEKSSSKRLLIPVFKSSVELNNLESSEVGSLIFGEYLKYIKCSKFSKGVTLGTNTDDMKLSTISTLLEFPLGIKCIDRNLDETFKFIKLHLINNSPYNSPKNTLWLLDPQLGLRTLLNLSIKYTAKLERLTIDHRFINMLVKCLADKKLPTDINMLAGDLLSLLNVGTNRLEDKNEIYINKLDFFKSNGDFLSWLGYLHGIIHLWGVGYWTQVTNDKCLFNFIIFDLIRFNTKLPQNLPSSYLVVSVDLLATLLMTLARHNERFEPNIDNIVVQLTTDKIKLTQVIALIFNLWSHPVEALQYKIKNLLVGLLLLYRSHTNRVELVNDILNRTIRLEYHSKAKYGILNYLLPYLDKPSQCLELDKQFLANTLDMLKLPLMAPKAGIFLGLYITLLYKQLVIKDKVKLNEFEKIVFLPLVDKLLDKGYNFRKPISLYILPKLIPLNSQISFNLLGLISERSLAASIAILKVIRSLGLPLPTNLCKLESAIYSSDSQVRIDLLELLCETRKGNCLISASEYCIMIKIFKFNFNGVASDFHQKFTASSLKFLVRVKNNLIASTKNRTGSNIVEIKIFLSTLIDLIITSFYPGSSPCRISNSLSVLSSFLSIFSWHYEEYFDESTPPKITTSKVLFTTLGYIIMNGYEHNRLLAYNLIKSYPGDLDFVGLFNWCFVRTLSNRAIDAESGAYWLDFLISKVVFSPDYNGCLHFKTSLLQSYIKNYNNGEMVKTTDCNQINFFIHLLYLLELTINAAECRIKNNECPSISNHGILIVLQLMVHQLEKRNILMLISSGQLKSDKLNGWKLVIKEAFKLCHRVLAQVEPLLAQKSPEGLEGDKSYLEADIERQPESQTQFRNLLSYCWRGCKEASALLGLMVEYLPISISARDNGLLSYEQIIKTGIRFQTMFNSLRHRGAFSSVYPNYLKLNIRLLQSRQRDLSRVVKSWLDYHIDQVNCPNSESTRRSGGLPLGILAILNSFIEVGGGCNEISATLDKLIAWAKDGDKETAHRIHAFNTLKFLLTDAKLGSIISGIHTEQGYQLAINGFSSKEWGVRNSSIMLFTTLLNRTFGSKRTRDEHDTVNRLTGREFFGRYPYLLPYLINNLRLVVEKLESDTVGVPEGLYPILTLLTRLSPSVMGGDGNLMVFKPLVMTCSKSRVYKIREMSSKALAPLLSGPNFPQNIQELVKNLSIVTSENELHGNLLQIEAGLNLNYNSFLRSSNFEIISEFIRISSELIKLFISTNVYKNSCNINKGLLLTNISILFKPSINNGDLQQTIAKELNQIKTVLKLSNISITHDLYNINELKIKAPLIKLNVSSPYDWLNDSLQDVRLLVWGEISSRGELDNYHTILLDHIFGTNPDYTCYYKVSLINLLLDNYENPFVVKKGIIVEDYLTQGELWEWSVLRVRKHQPVSLISSALRLMGKLLNNHLLTPSTLFGSYTSLVTYTALIKELSNVVEVLELRQSVIDSLRELNLIEILNNLRGSNLIEFIISIVNLIQDDNENIRIKTVELLFKNKIIDDNYHCDKTLENFFWFVGDKFATSTNLHGWLWSNIRFTQDELNSTFETIKPYNNRSLFEVEAPNQYIEPIKLIQLSYHTLLKIESKGIQTIHFDIKECCMLINSLNFYYRDINNEEFGPLGVSSVDSVFYILSKSVLCLKLIQNSPSLTNGEKLAIRATFEQLGHLNKVYPLHPLVLSLLRAECDNSLKNVSSLTNYLISLN